MRISGIRLLGFKSFADKTELVLDPGITAIVGPNGCGKSNVIDAVKWVLGEQRPSSLRAKEMMDVIFSGAGGRRALGMSEVSLVLDNSDGRIPLEQTEVVLTRRLYRSGESDYLINGRRCRLRDLREALMDTGSGLDAFSIMEQGKIDRILTANPVERRTVFEEASGIGKFKARRKETLRRLERIGDDLTRLRDVIEITEKQLRSLRYQASRANRYRTLSEDLKKKRVTWALYRYHAFLTERARITAELDAAAEKESRAGDELGALLTDLSGEESSFETLGVKVQGAEAELLTLAAEIRSSREGAEHARRLSAELA
ncbi:MAG: AAA family ATPase, partial [Planctomycetota bacterium]